ncbi:hypothetical protein Bca52824_040252 [Brassica carinata]|uniref:Uncharacterized protein n=1 Tax=Brassica carinata TaxID=52824 RepID=A0A8X7RUI4_BRACI|nr:hypothetical protein Bca52824_040252 [Brassica carinata]
MEQQNEERNYGEDMDFGWDDRDYGRAEGRKTVRRLRKTRKTKESGEEKDVVSGGENSKDGEKENNEKGEEEKDQEPEKDKENSDSVEKGEEYVEESDGESSLLRLQERELLPHRVIVITPHGRTKAAAARKAIYITEIVVVMDSKKKGRPKKTEATLKPCTLRRREKVNHHGGCSLLSPRERPMS